MRLERAQPGDTAGLLIFDFALPSSGTHDPVAFEAAAREVGFLGFGFYPRSGFIHVDLGPARQWGERFPVRATAFAAETPPAREVLADSRTMKGGGAAGVATLGAAGVEVAQSVLAETQTAILPLVPYLDTLRWVFIAVALGGHRGHDLRPPRRLAPGAAVIGGLARRDRHEPMDAGGAALRRHRARRAPVPAFASALRRASGTPRRTPRNHGEGQ